MLDWILNQLTVAGIAFVTLVVPQLINKFF